MFPEVVELIRWPIDTVASDPDKSRTDLSLRKRFEVNLSGRCWWQYRLQKFGNYLKLSPLFFLLLQTLLFPVPTPLSLCLLDSTHLQLRGLFFPRWDTYRSDLHYTPETLSPPFLCTRHHFLKCSAISLYIHAFFDNSKRMNVPFRIWD